MRLGRLAHVDVQPFMPKPRALPSPAVSELLSRELDITWAPKLQRFFDRNPLYFQTVCGEPASSSSAQEELTETPPEGWPYSRQWRIGYVDSSQELVAFADVVSDLLAVGVWHIGLFLLATERHGTGDAQLIFAELERWARQAGARWLRLGVVKGNTRAERFWSKQGFVQTRVREGVAMGRQTNTIRVLVKPLGTGTVHDYLQLVERDRPEGAV